MKVLEHTAFVFPGQGSQSLGMLGELSTEFPSILSSFKEASEVLSYDLWDVCQNQEAKLNQTEVTQPAILTASVALWRVAQEIEPFRPALLSGHSLGEYTALVCSEVLGLKEAVTLVEKRGQFMQAAVTEGDGAMAAILGLDDSQILAACAQAEDGQVVSAVNFNSPGQVVIAGQKAAVDRAIDLCKSAGARKAIPLAVSVPSHCASMAPAGKELEGALSSFEFSKPSIPFVNNVDVASLEDPKLIKQALIDQLTQPVRWVEIIEYFASSGVEHIVECGPGKVLSGLGKRINKSIAHTTLNTSNDLKSLAGK